MDARQDVVVKDSGKLKKFNVFLLRGSQRVVAWDSQLPSFDFNWVLHYLANLISLEISERRMKGKVYVLLRRKEEARQQ